MMRSSVTIALICLAAMATTQQLLPGDDDVIAREWAFDEDTQGWAPTNNLTGFEVTDGVLRTQATGDDANMAVTAVGVDCADVSHLIVRMRSTQAGTTQVYFTTSEHPDPAANSVPTFGVSGRNEFRTHEVAVAGLHGWSGTLGMLRLDPVNGMGTSAEIEIDYVRLVRKAPRLELVQFAPDRVWVRPGEKVTLTLVVRDTTRGPEVDGLSAVMGPDDTKEQSVDLPLTYNADAGTYTATCAVTPETSGRWTSEVQIGDAPVTRATTVIIALDAADLPAPSGEARAGDNELGPFIENADVSLQLVGESEALAGIVRGLADEGWAPVAVLAPLASVSLSDRDGERHLAASFHHTTPDGYSLVIGGFPGVEPVESSIQSSASVRFSLKPGDRGFEVTSRLRAASPCSVLRFSGPTLLAGEGSFGESKECALFPGIEFLEADQRSSSTEAVGDSLGHRPSPAPFQITVPLMAVEADGVLVGRMWDPLQKWGGDNTMPMAEFASPNFLDQQANHAMSTFVPGHPDWTMPNKRQASTPYELGPGESVTVEERLFAIPGGRITDAVPLWYETYGLPEPVETAKPMAETLDDLMEGWASTCYDPETDKFVNHWRIGQTPFEAPNLKAALLTHHLRTGETRWIERCGVAPDTRYVDLLGSMFEGFGEGDLPGAMATQAEDGSWPYEVTPEKVKRTEEFTNGQRHDLGEDGTTCAGLIAVNALGVLAHAAQTGNPESEAAGLEALEAITRYRSPAGAQTWEVHKDIGDIYAAALIIDCFRLGYELTEDRKWLDEALYWAYTGLPFLYSYQVPNTGPGALISIPGDPDTEGDDPLQGTRQSSVAFQDPDRQITPYASIPVFGTSFYVVSWFGNVVQWCGLCWASSVYDLLEHADDPLLRHVADGTVASGCQQTLDKSPMVGLLPDTWHLGNNMIHPAYIGPVRVETPLRKALGRPSFAGARTRVIHGAGRAHVASRGTIVDGSLTGKRLTFALDYPTGQVSETAILGLDEPKAVSVGGERLPRVDDLEQADQGWRYAEGPGRIDIRAIHGESPVEVRVGL